MADYRAVKDEGVDHHADIALGDDTNGYDYPTTVQSRSWPFHKLLIPISLAVSLLFNAFLVTRLNTRASPNTPSSVSKFGRLEASLSNEGELTSGL